MQDFIESSDYLNPKRPGRRRRILIVAALLFVAFLVVRVGFSSWVDLLWFESLGYGEGVLENGLDRVCRLSDLFGDHLRHSVWRFLHDPAVAPCGPAE